MSDRRPPGIDTYQQPDDVMFSAAVRAEQACRGSREMYEHQAAAGRFTQPLSADVIAFIGGRDSAFFATASADGQPYVQHRGGPPGFLKMLDERTVAFAEYAGNRQYISIGNLAENGRSFMVLMDYAKQRRLKLWGRATVAGEALLLARLADPAYSARIERAIVLTVLAWDWNCSDHIPRLVPAQAAR